MFRATVGRSILSRSWKMENRYFCNAAQVPQTKELPLHPVESLQSEYASGWKAPLGTLEDLPFTFFRTNSKMLPVYYRFRKHNTQYITVLRKYRGDSSAICNELRKLLGKDVKLIKYQGRIELQGDYRTELRTWLQRLGF